MDWHVHIITVSSGGRGERLEGWGGDFFCLFCSFCHVAGGSLRAHVCGREAVCVSARHRCAFFWCAYLLT